ncbi:hypothetical protein [Mycobacterium triplex]|uniref:hypothetical protein n=1 Tax=Mycobacterium triplex TaxID=47839 RepID=UPI00111C2AFA|nr:hypothetical protein [Mycobacterium triplex]
MAGAGRLRLGQQIRHQDFNIDKHLDDHQRDAERARPQSIADYIVENKITETPAPPSICRCPRARTSHSTAPRP